METDATQVRLSETWDRMVLLLLTTPREGWEPEYEELTWREIERLAVSSGEAECDE